MSTSILWLFLYILFNADLPGQLEGAAAVSRSTISGRRVPRPSRLGGEVGMYIHNVYIYIYIERDIHTHILTHTCYTHVYIYIYIYIEREREREREREIVREGYPVSKTERVKQHVGVGLSRMALGRRSIPPVRVRNICWLVP